MSRVLSAAKLQVELRADNSAIEPGAVGRRWPIGLDDGAKIEVVWPRLSKNLESVLISPRSPYYV